MSLSLTSGALIERIPATRKVLVWLMLLLLTIGGFFVRAQHLRGADGTLGEDEARLALAAQGILNTGVPTMPSGKIYLRGMISSYLTAPSLWLFGRHDFAARLPNTVVGTLLIPLLFFFGRALAGTTAGFCLAVFAAIQPELVRWSTSAWMTSLFIVLFMGATYLLYLGYERDRLPFQVSGAAASVLTVLAHELGVLLALAVILTVTIRSARSDFGWFDGRRSTTALVILGFSLLLSVALGLFLRAGSVAGPLGEFKHYLDPSLSLNRFFRDYTRWSSDYLPLAAAVVLGIPLLLRSLKSGGLFLYATILVASFTIWVIIAKDSERYGLVLIPLLPLAATWAVAEIVRLTGIWSGLEDRAVGRLRAGAIVLLFAASLRNDLAVATLWPEARERTWLTEFRALGIRSRVISCFLTIPRYRPGT